MSGELIVPVGLIVGGIKGECLVVDTLIVPLAQLIEDIHLLCNVVSIDHVKIKHVVLLEPYHPRGAPVIIGSDGNYLLYWDPVLIDAPHSEDMKLQVASVREELHLEHEMLGCKAL